MDINLLTAAETESLRSLILSSDNIILCCHRSPDGDALGSLLGMAEFLRQQGKVPVAVVPDAYPDFLQWLPGTERIIRYDKHKSFVDGLLASADLVFCLDFNTFSRTDDMADTLAASPAKKVLVDHHLNPDIDTELCVSHPEACSTCELVFRLIWQIGSFDMMTRKCAVPLYCGMMTDTGNFAFSFLTPELFRAVAVLVEKGISIPDIHNNVYNAYTEGRARLFGYAINRKMEVIQDGTVAYMSLMENEMRRFQFQQGDSEGFVNYALTIKKVKMSAMFLAHRKFIRVSLRSRGDVDVNLFARKYFSGGGHKNAAGGKSFVSMQETIDHYIRSVKEFAAEGHLG